MSQLKLRDDVGERELAQREQQQQVVHEDPQLPPSLVHDPAATGLIAIPAAAKYRFKSRMSIAAPPHSWRPMDCSSCFRAPNR